MMRRHKPSSGLTMLETLIVIGIVACLGIMLFPAIQSAREAARRIQCDNNMKRLGLAMHNYGQVFRVFPPSSTVTRNADGRIAAVDGWSWMVLVLPYMERLGQPSQDETGRFDDNKRLYETLDILHGRPLVEPAGAKGTPHADALATSLPGLLCPSFGGSPYSTTATGKSGHHELQSLGRHAHRKPQRRISQPADAEIRPRQDAIGISPIRTAFFPGTSIDISCCPQGPVEHDNRRESVEQNFSRWTVGAEAAVVGCHATWSLRNATTNLYGLPRWRYGDSHSKDGRNRSRLLDLSHLSRLGLRQKSLRRFGRPSRRPIRAKQPSSYSGQPPLRRRLVKALSKDIDVALYMWLIERRTLGMTCPDRGTP